MATHLLIDGHSLSSESDFHDTIERAARAVGFEGYGRNLDALWDVLTGFLELPVEARLTNTSAASVAIGLRFDRIVRIFEDAERELGENFRFEMS